MNCERCARELAEAEPVYRYRVFGGSHVTVCGACAETLPHLFPWRAVTASPHTCRHCGRPIIFSTGYWPASRQHHSVCSPECRKALHAAAARERRRLAPRDCATCGKPFPPRRADACFCSHACRQKAYRARIEDARFAPIRELAGRIDRAG